MEATDEFTGTIDANTTIEFDTSLTGNMHAIDNAFYRYNNGSLDDDLIIKFTEPLTEETSAVTIILPNQT